MRFRSTHHETYPWLLSICRVIYEGDEYSNKRALQLSCQAFVCERNRMTSCRVNNLPRQTGCELTLSDRAKNICYNRQNIVLVIPTKNIDRYCSPMPTAGFHDYSRGDSVKAYFPSNPLTGGSTPIFAPRAPPR
jgi:hypothetical protein